MATRRRKPRGAARARVSARRGARKHGRMRGIVGRDLSAFEKRGGPRRLVPLALAMLVAAIALVALRTEVLKLRYELARGLEREQELGAERRDLTVRMRQLRDPMRLAQRANELGFVRPQRVIDLTRVHANAQTSLAASDAPHPHAELRP